MKKSLFKAAIAFGIVLSLNAYADQGGSHKGMDMGGMKIDCSKQMENMKGMEGMKMECMGGDKAKPTSMSMSEGEVKAVDKKNKTVTLKHGPIKNKTVDMTPMTMSFPVQGPALLANVKVGDKVKFVVENVKNVPTVTALDPQK
jgi:Cu(I)/Ag(I) efflux system periplasmic protein CusF